MDFVTTLLIVLQVLSALALVVLVLLQHGKGADMGAAFGSGASASPCAPSVASALGRSAISSPTAPCSRALNAL